MSGHILQPGISNGNNCDDTIPRIIRFCTTLAQPILRPDPAPRDREESPRREVRRACAMQAIFSGRAHFANFTIVLRVSVEFLVTTPGPPLKKCQAEYCSM